MRVNLQKNISNVQYKAKMQTITEETFHNIRVQVITKIKL